MPPDHADSGSDPSHGKPSAPRAGWRGGGGKGAEGPTQRWRKDWTRRADDEHRADVRRHRLKIAGWSLLAVALVGAVIAVLPFFPKTTPVVAVVLTEYPWPAPPNAWAREDLEGLSALDRRTLAVREITDAWTNKDRALRSLAEAVQSSKLGGPKRDCLIVYLSAHGVVDEQGRPCLLFAGPSPWTAESRLPVRDVLQAIKDSARPKSKTIVVFDAGRIDANWSMGLLYNGFAERLQGAIDEVDAPNLVVVNSAGPAQVGRHSAELGGSVFGHFLRRGLAGDADRAGNDDGRVSIRELHGYLTLQVGQWVLANRFDRQEPQLLVSRGTPDDFDVAWNEPGEQATTPPAAAGESDPALTDLWMRHQALTSREPVRTAPMVWEEFQQSLLRFEQLSGAGKAYQRAATEWKGRAERLAATLEEPSKLAVADALSLPAAKQYAARPAPPRELQEQFLKQLNDPAVKATADLELNYFDRAPIVVDWIAKSPSPERVRRGLQFCGAPPAGAHPGVIELHFAQMLEKHVEPDVWSRHADFLARLLELRNRAERATVSSDDRVVYYLQRLADLADRLRRRAEDLALVGDTGSITAAERDAAEAEKGFQAVADAAELWADAWRVQDRVDAELPYLLQWALRRSVLETGNVPAPVNAEQWAATARSFDALAKMLDGDPAKSTASDGLAAARTTARDTLDQLRKAYDDECYRLRFETGTDQKSVRDLADVLAVPLATGQARKELRSSLERVHRSLAQTYREPQQSDAKPPTEAGTVALKRLGEFEFHPAQWIARPADDAPDAKPSDAYSALSRLGERVRKTLAGEAHDVQQLMRTGAGELEGNTTPAWTARKSYAAADHRARRLAPLSQQVRETESDADPTQRLAALDRHHVLVWQAQRALDDFWAAANPETEPYFAVAAEHNLRTAERLCREAIGQREAAMQLLTARRTAAGDGLHPQCTPDSLVVIDAAQTLMQRVAVQPGAGFPAGTAAVALRDKGGDALRLQPTTAAAAPTRRIGLTLPDAAAATREVRADYSLSGEQLLTRGQNLQLDALFRGHVYPAPVYVVQSQAGVTITHLRPEPQNPRVTVFGDLQRQTAITFILDCSGSMSEIVQLDNQKRNRLDVARSALQAILDGVATSKAYRVGVRVYGHRAQWKDRFSSEVVDSAYGRRKRQDAEAAGLAYAVHPSNDVELILPLGAFGRPEADVVKATLDDLRPAGETPLYLAVIQAIENDFRGEAEAAQRRIVVITDGVNEQSPGGPAGVIRVRRQVEQALDARREQPVRLDIVGFDVTAGDAASREKLQDLKDIATRSGGAYYPASDPSELLKALEDSLGLSRFVVENAQGVLVGEPRDLGSTLELERPGDRPQDYVVRLVGAESPLTGGGLRAERSEGFELFLSADKRRFEHHRYFGTREQEIRDSLTNLLDPLQAGRQVFVGAHLPEWQGSGVRFPISVQNADERLFSPMPAEAWVEIQPASVGGKAPPPYVFYDMTFEPRRPVPVLSCLATSWPTKSVKAEIRLWCKFAPTAPDLVVAASQAVQAGGLQLPALADVQFKVTHEPGKTSDEEDRWTIVEQYPPGTSDLHQVRIALDPPPLRTNHTYYVEAAMVRHQFAYRGGDAAQRQQVQIRLTTRKKLQDQALVLPRPLVITIPDPLLRK